MAALTSYFLAQLDLCLLDTKVHLQIKQALVWTKWLQTLNYHSNWKRKNKAQRQVGPAIRGPSKLIHQVLLGTTFLN